MSFKTLSVTKRAVKRPEELSHLERGYADNGDNLYDVTEIIYRSLDKVKWYISSVGVTSTNLTDS